VNVSKEKMSKKDIFASGNFNDEKMPKLPQIFNKMNNQSGRYNQMNLNLKQLPISTPLLF
jgi:hypothetical protein